MTRRPTPAQNLPLSVSTSNVHSSSGTWRRRDPAHLGGVLAQVLTLGAHPHRRGEVQLVVGLLAALLDVHGRGLAGEVVHPAQSLREHGAVRLDRGAVALLEAVARVVAAQEGLLDVLFGVEDQRWDPLERGWRVELFAQPAPGGRSSRSGRASRPWRLSVQSRVPVHSREFPMNSRDHSTDARRRRPASLLVKHMPVLDRGRRSRRPPSAPGTRPARWSPLPTSCAPASPRTARAHRRAPRRAPGSSRSPSRACCGGP